MKIVAWLVYALFFSALLGTTLINDAAHAVIEERQFEDPELNERFKNLIAELRCLVCQNQNLADSDASLAKDLRDKTAEMLQAGKTDQEILDYMSERYGEFVLYRPPFNLSNAVLWVGPFLILLIVVIMLRRNISQRQSGAGSGDSDSQNDNEKRQKVRELLRSSPNIGNRKDH